MNFMNKLSPKRLFRSNKKDRSIGSRLDPSLYSSGSGTSSSSSSSESVSSLRKRGPYASTATTDFGTPTSVLPEISGDWSDFSPNSYFELCEAFKIIDKDNDGVITTSELEALLSKFAPHPPTREEVSLMLSELDGDGNGCISLNMLSQVVGPAFYEPAGEPELKETFDIFDTDHDGKITAEELMAFYKETIGDERCTLEDCRRMIASVDRNGDGFVCFEDFSRMMEVQT